MNRTGGLTRSVRAPALAKINLDLRVIARRPDGFHELRTVFHTISLADTIDVEFTPGPRTRIELQDETAIPGNLVLKAAEAVMHSSKARGSVRMRLSKKIPMGAGLGGGSSDAAAVLLALPALTGRPLPVDKLCELAAGLGSDVPFFLLGGAAVGIGRGVEVFPLPDMPSRPAVLICSPIHSSTAEAYAQISSRLTSESEQNKIFSFQSLTWSLGAGGVGGNDFEAVVFARHSRLAALRRMLTQAGASAAMMTGSGSAIFGLFRNGKEASLALRRLAGPSGLRENERTFRVSLVNRARYRSLWARALATHGTPQLWPPQSRYF